MNKVFTKTLGFTLAEVIIVIGIIGLIAESTIPTLIQKTEEEKIVVGLKKTYSELLQAVMLSELENGSFRDWDYGLSQKEFAEEYIMPFLAKDYKCLGRFYSEHNRRIITGTDGVKIDIPWDVYQYGGKYIILEVSNGKWPFATFWVDINADRGNHLMGKDVFVFTLFNYTYNYGPWELTDICPKGEHYGLHIGTNGGLWGAYCATSVEAVLGEDKVRGDCNKNGRGSNCGVAIAKNGWKIPSDYPIKF